MGPLDEFVIRADGAMLVVTVGSDDGLFGCLVGFHTQVSIDPRRYLVCLSDANATTRAARDASELGVHLLGASQLGLASWFGERTADDGIDKFERCSWQRTGDGPPILDGVPVWFTGRIVDRISLGDHTAHVLEPVRTGEGPLEEPLRFGATNDLDAGH